MSSNPARTQRTTAPPRASGYPEPGYAEPAAPPRGGLEVSTLVAAAVASVVAATVVSRVWQQGTIMATAMTPVVVALVKEMVERPARRVSSIAARSGAPPLARNARAVAEPPPEAYAPPPPVGPGPQYTQMRVYRRERATPGRRWKLAIATGLLAFLIGAAAMTLPELVAGRSVVSGSHHTTIFGGHRATPAATTKTDKKTTTAKHKTTTTESQPQDTTTQTTPGPTTTTPGQTATQPPAQGQAAPTQTQPPAQTQTTTPPAQTQTQPPPTTTP
jgi:hypothetical protein